MKTQPIAPSLSSPSSPIREVQLGDLEHGKNGDNSNNVVASKRGATVECYDMSFYVNGKQKTKILSHLEVSFVPGELTALMGPSGAGKICLMNSSIISIQFTEVK